MLKKLVRYFKVGIWQVQDSSLSPVKRLCLDVLKKLILTIRFFTARKVMNVASALTYSTLLAIVPIMAVVFAIARGFGYNKYIEVWFRETFESQPQAAEAIIGFVNSYLTHTKSGVILGIGLVFFYKIAWANAKFLFELMRKGINVVIPTSFGNLKNRINAVP